MPFCVFPALALHFSASSFWRHHCRWVPVPSSHAPAPPSQCHSHPHVCAPLWLKVVHISHIFNLSRRLPLSVLNRCSWAESHCPEMAGMSRPPVCRSWVKRWALSVLVQFMCVFQLQKEIIILIILVLSLFLLWRRRWLKNCVFKCHLCPVAW